MSDPQFQPNSARQAPGPGPGPDPGPDAGPPAWWPRTMILARLVLVGERLWLALWRAGCIVGLFLALALLDVLPRLPGWLHVLVLALVAVVLVVAVLRGFRGFRWPAEVEAVRRVELDNGLAHRPLSTVRDRLSSGGDDGVAAALWRFHCKEMLGRVGRVRLPRPRSGLAARDPLGLRAVAGLALVAAAAGSWGDWGPRLAAALVPELNGGGSAMPPALDIWLTPPAYTGAAPVFLQRADAGPEARPAATGTTAATAAPPLAVPAGSLVLAQVSGGVGVPTLTVNGREQPFKAIDDSHFQVRDTVRAGSVVAVGQNGRTLGRWAISVMAEPVPTVAFAAPPSVSDHQRLHLDYIAGDEYGIAAVAATVRPDPTVAFATGGDQTPLVLPLSLPGLRPKSVHAGSDHDLTGSPWAGLPVLIRLSASDGGGRLGVSAELPMVLPERSFTNPVAKEIVSQRKVLALRGEGARTGVARALGALSARPAAFHDDGVVFLALRVASAELVEERDPLAVPAVRDLLWETALRLEDGGLSLAERDLGNARQALAEALDRKAGAEEVRRLVDELQAALDRYLEALEQQAETAARNGEPLPALPPGAMLQTVDRADLEGMLQSLRDMAAAGADDGARQVLSDLDRLLENLKNTGDVRPDADQARDLEMLGRLQQLAARQQDLLDRTFRRSQDQAKPGAGPPPSPPPPPPSVGDQGALRQQLGALMLQMGEKNGEIPKSLGQAERAMHQAEQALRDNDTEGAVAAEAQAMDDLRQGLRDFSRKVSAGMLVLPGEAMHPGDGRDPLGRRLPGPGNSSSGEVALPEGAELQRSREILDELRRRAGQQQRPHQELEYIQRLLRQF